MRTARALLASLAWLLAASALRSVCADEEPTPVHQAIEDCRSRVVPAAEATSKGVGDLCPQLAVALYEAGLTEQLPSGWQKSLHVAQLPDLEWLLQRYSQAPSVAGPDPRALAPILQGLQPSAEPHSWWQRLLAWLRHLMTQSSAAAPPWMERVLAALKRTPPWVGRAILDAGVAAVIGLLVVLLWREGRLLWADRRPMRRVGRPGEPGPQGWDSLLTPDTVDAAPVRERPTLLLRLLTQTLVAQGRLTGDLALTHGELVARSTFTDGEQRQRFARITRLAEARRFADSQAFDRQHPGGEVDAVLAEGRALYAQLLATSPPATP